MLIELSIRNLAIVAEVTVRFEEGLNILSGETGAGKSIILQGLGLVLGARATSDQVRSGEEEAEVEATFDAEPELVARLAALDLAVEPGEAIAVRRVLSAAGRSRAYVAGKSVSAGVLRELAPLLVDYAGQHEHHVLLDETRHLDLLDRFGALVPDRDAVSRGVAALRGAEAELATLEAREADRAQREDFLRFQWRELSDAGVRSGEEAELETDRRRLAHADRLARETRAAEEALYSGQGAAVDRLADAAGRLHSLVEVDPRLGPLVTELESARVAAEEAARALREYGRHVENDPGRLDQIHERLQELQRLARKHRTDPEGLVARLAALEGELRTLEGADERRGALGEELVVRRAEVLGLARTLSDRRTDAASRLASAVESELRDLGMPRARFEVGIQRRGDGRGDLDAHGLDDVRFLLAANAGEEARPLVKVASGGELSRVLLAVKRALAGAGRVQTFVFDEIDTGIGGATADVVGAKLHAISAEGQVLCITHLAHIAAYADAHFTVRKVEAGGRTRTRVERLDPDGRVVELARMVGGSTLTEASRGLARELLDRRQVGA